LLRECERARVERVGELLVVLGDHAGAAAARAIQLDQLDVEQRCDLGHRAVQLGGEAAAHAAGPVCDLHCSPLPSPLCSPASPSSPWSPFPSPPGAGCSASASAARAVPGPTATVSLSVSASEGGPGSGSPGSVLLGVSPAGACGVSEPSSSAPATYRLSS